MRSAAMERGGDFPLPKPCEYGRMAGYNGGERGDRESAVTLVEKYRELFVEAVIFGSTAVGEADEYSDLDLVLVRETELPFVERAKEVLPLLRESGGADLLIYTPEEYERERRRGGFVAQVTGPGSVRIEGKQKRRGAVVEAGGE